MTEDAHVRPSGAENTHGRSRSPTWFPPASSPSHSLAPNTPDVRTSADDDQPSRNLSRTVDGRAVAQENAKPRAAERAVPRERESTAEWEQERTILSVPTSSPTPAFTYFQTVADKVVRVTG